MNLTLSLTRGTVTALVPWGVDPRPIADALAQRWGYRSAGKVITLSTTGHTVRWLYRVEEP